MKAPREILLRQHQTAEPKLDAIRRTVVAEQLDNKATKEQGRKLNFVSWFFGCSNTAWREFIFSLRWHLAGMGAAWLLIILLNLNVGHSVALASAVPAAKIPPPQIILASLRENRRELLQVIQPVESREVRPPKLFPRSERQNEILTA